MHKHLKINNPLMKYSADFFFLYVCPITVKSHWLEHLWDHWNLFETWVVRANKGESWRQVRKQMVIIREVFLIVYTIMVCWVYSLESTQWGNSNEYTQHTISCLNKKISLNICFLELSEVFVGTQKRIRIIQSKWAVGVRVIEVLL